MLIVLLVAIVGLLMYALATNSKLVEIGKWLFILAMFFVLSAISHAQNLRLLSGN